MKLSVIIPAYNEQGTFKELLRRVEAVDINKEIIIVDDGSTDGTRDILASLGDRHKIILHEKNQGKGAAIRTALEYVKGDIVVIQDADLEYDPNDYHKLMVPFVNDDAKVVFGSRTTIGKNKASYWRFFLGGQLVTFMANLLYGIRITDEATCYKALKSDLIKSLNLECERFEFCPEVTAKIAKLKIPIYEVPISYYPRKLDEGKKIGWRDGLEAITTLLKYKFKE